MKCSDKLSMPQPYGHGGLSFEYMEELFTSQVGSVDQFSLASYIERLRPFNTNVGRNRVFAHQEVLLFLSCGPLHELFGFVH